MADQVAPVIEVEEETGSASVGGGGCEDLALNLHLQIGDDGEESATAGGVLWEERGKGIPSQMR